MKFISVILVAVFCATIVSTAPSSIEPDFKEFIDVINRVYKCTYDDLSEVIRDTAYASEFEEVKPIMLKHHSAVVAECEKTMDAMKFMECFHKGLKQMQNESKVNNFMEKWMKENSEVFVRITQDCAIKGSL